MLLASFPENSGPTNKVDLEGRYSNFFKVGHNAYEFIIDFGQLYEDDPQKERIHSRIVTSPVYAKQLLLILSRAVDQYEGQYGEMNVD